MGLGTEKGCDELWMNLGVNDRDPSSRQERAINVKIMIL